MDDFGMHILWKKEIRGKVIVNHFFTNIVWHKKKVLLGYCKAFNTESWTGFDEVWMWILVSENPTEIALRVVGKKKILLIKEKVFILCGSQ